MPRWEYARVVRQVGKAGDPIVGTTIHTTPSTSERTGFGGGALEAHDAMNRLGADGWEACGVETFDTFTVYWFKRPIT
jgi:hypothetical protein